MARLLAAILSTAPAEWTQAALGIDPKQDAAALVAVISALPGEGVDEEIVQRLEHILADATQDLSTRIAAAARLREVGEGPTETALHALKGMAREGSSSALLELVRAGLPADELAAIAPRDGGDGVAPLPTATALISVGVIEPGMEALLRGLTVDSKSTYRPPLQSMTSFSGVSLSPARLERVLSWAGTDPYRRVAAGVVLAEVGGEATGDGIELLGLALTPPWPNAAGCFTVLTSDATGGHAEESAWSEVAAHLGDGSGERQHDPLQTDLRNILRSVFAGLRMQGSSPGPVFG